MADQEAKSELSKEVLAPAEGIREDLVATAVKFLQNPKVQQSALSQKKAFLQRKGLTSEEIEVAVKRAGIQQNVVAQGNAGYQDTVAMQQETTPEPPLKDHTSTWMKARHVLGMVTMVSGISYAAYKLYKEFVGPWLFNYETSDRRLEKLEKIVAESVANMNTTLTSIEETLGKQQEKLQLLSHDVNRKIGVENNPIGQNSSNIGEIKSELSSIKGLLLNRRQFPSIPTATPVLPSWQLANNSGDANSNNKSESSSEETTVEILMSSNPAPESIVIQDTESDFDSREQDETEISLSKENSEINIRNKNIKDSGHDVEVSGSENGAGSEKENQEFQNLVTEECSKEELE